MNGQSECVTTTCVPLTIAPDRQRLTKRPLREVLTSSVRQIVPYLFRLIRMQNQEDHVNSEKYLSNVRCSDEDANVRLFIAVTGV